MTILLATANLHKLEELTALLPGHELLTLRDFPGITMPEETGTTMAANARLKAEHCAKESGLPALADDSGIEVDFLDGKPGVHSARWVEGTDADRTNALLEKLKSVPDQARTARYRAAICVAFPNGELLQTEATCEGKITHAPRGTNGFGYDPIFEITPATGTSTEWHGKTMAEAPPNVKAQVSHRARAVRAIRELFSQVLN